MKTHPALTFGQISCFLRLLALLLTAAAFPATAEARWWANRDGRLLEADLVSIQPAPVSTVTLRVTATGRDLTVALSILSAADQAFLMGKITPAPALSLLADGKARLEWDEFTTDRWRAQRATDLRGPWQTVTQAVVKSGTRCRMDLTRSGPRGFFRLVKP